MYTVYSSFTTSSNTTPYLSGLVKTKGNDVRVQQRNVERCDVEVEVRQHDSHGAVDDTFTIIHVAQGLVCIAGVVASHRQRRVGQVQLLTPANELWCPGCRGSDIGVIGTHGQAGCFPLEEDLLAWEGERLRLVVGDCWSATVAGDVEVLTTATGKVGARWVGNAGANSLTTVLCGVVGRVAVDVGVVQDAEGWEVLPCETGSVLGAVADVLCKHGPCP